jgi:dipeptidyl aminopeptidase/acylaminoacyl peptidase
MIVYTYEILSNGVHRYTVPTERSYYNYAVWTAQGYFVLMPDIVYRPRDPGRSAVEAVVPAVQSIVDKGLVDPARVGLIGHSWGGYQAAYIPTQTNIFAASVAGAPITDFVSFPGTIHWNPGLPELEHWETGQGRMDVPPWEDFEAHVRNSATAFIDRLETPMLVEVGDADGVVEHHQGIEYYNFARRIGNPDFVLLLYPDEDHGLRQKQNQIDYHHRILQWFGHWLKGEEAPEWITHGVSWLDRKKALEGTGR